MLESISACALGISLAMFRAMFEYFTSFSPAKISTGIFSSGSLDHTEGTTPWLACLKLCARPSLFRCSLFLISRENAFGLFSLMPSNSGWDNQYLINVAVPFSKIMSANLRSSLVRFPLSVASSIPAVAETRHNVLIIYCLLSARARAIRPPREYPTKSTECIPSFPNMAKMCVMHPSTEQSSPSGKSNLVCPGRSGIISVLCADKL